MMQDFRIVITYFILGAVSRFTVWNISNTSISFLPGHCCFLRNSPNRMMANESNKSRQYKNKTFFPVYVYSSGYTSTAVENFAERCIAYLLFSTDTTSIYQRRKTTLVQTNNVPKPLSKPGLDHYEYITADDKAGPARVKRQMQVSQQQGKVS